MKVIALSNGENCEKIRENQNNEIHNLAKTKKK